jgi:phenylpropionate dioxygenase-like ring-hydroxylating dioxygenase large terminal subunit
LQPPRFFDGLEGFSYGRAYDPWDAHYSRVIENQLDVAHLPFVHYNTIGRGDRTLVNGPVVQWVGDDMFYFYVYNQVDDGTSPRKPEEITPDPARDFRLGFIFPNLWQNYISDDVRVLAAFVPVDDAHTLLYLRFYQRFVRLPILRDIVNWLAMPGNRYIAHQDRRVVVTQQPKPSALRTDEQLIQADRPIVEYRRRRQELLKEAQR